jgi:hypothetical protein
VQRECGAMPRKYTGPDKLNDLLTKAKVARKYLGGLQQFLPPELLPGDYPHLKAIAEGIQSYDTSAMKSAFAAANLDSTNLFDRNKLLRIFAELHYGEPAKGGPPRKWNRDSWSQLLADYSSIKQQNPKARDKIICQKIIKSFGGRYGGIDPQTLRRNLASAKNPNKNEYLQILSKQIVPWLDDYLRKENIELSDASIRELSLERALKLICAKWGDPHFAQVFFERI